MVDWKRRSTTRKKLLWTLVILGVISIAALSGGTIQPPRSLEAQASVQAPLAASDGAVTTGVFSPAHRSVGEAVRHFLGLRDEPSQPIAYSHRLHVQEVGLGCEFCHDGVSVSPVAGLPSVSTCMLCHSEVGREIPEVEALADYSNRGLEPPWERVYGWREESHVRFKHQPHYEAGIGCANCHGDVGTMDAAERAVDHSMSFCVDCHVETRASFDCVTCHY